MDKIRVIELFAGYGSQHLALKRLKRDYTQFEYDVVAFCEIEDSAIKAYQALHGDHIPNLGDITKVNPSDVPDCDLMTWSFPCTDISSAGLQQGLSEGSDTRSSLCWDAMRIFEAKRPKYLLMENVSALVSERFVKDFNQLQLSLQKLGYTNFMQLINSKDMGVPQNRLRIFMVSILDCNESYYFPKPFPLKKRLKDVLEKSVPESCYLSQERVDGLVLGSDSENAIEGEPVISAMRGRSDGEWYGSEHQQRLEIGGSDTSNSLTSVAKDNLLLEPAILSQQRTEEGKEIRRQHKGDVGIPYSHKELVPREDGISNTLSTVEKDNLLIEPAIIEDFYQDRPIRVYEGEAPTLRSDRAGLKVAEPIILGWVRDTKGNIVSRPEVDVANCVTAGKRDNTQNYVLEQVIEEVRKGFPNRGILMYKGNPYFVRKLSTRELYRLMDLSETDIDTLLNSGISKTQHSRLAGNSIVVSVLYHIFRTMFIDTVPIAGTQTTLF